MELNHEDTLTLQDVKELCPEAVEEAEDIGLTHFWVNDLEDCEGDPVAIVQGEKKFSLGGAYDDTEDSHPFIWDTESKEWLLVA